MILLFTTWKCPPQKLIVGDIIYCFKSNINLRMQLSVCKPAKTLAVLGVGGGKNVMIKNTSWPFYRQTSGLIATPKLKWSRQLCLGYQAKPPHLYLFVKMMSQLKTKQNETHKRNWSRRISISQSASAIPQEPAQIQANNKINQLQ